MFEGWFKRIALFLCINWIFWQNYFNQLPSDIGDGIMHYFISNAVWSDPINLLDHWGKPFYILLSCTFSLLGMKGIILYNILVFLFTVWIGWKIMDHLKMAEVWKVSFPFFLILTAEYATTLLSALTEPTFSLFFLAGTWFFLQRKWALFAIFMGILPFCRSEGQLAILMAAGILVLYRQWQALLFLPLPFLLYALIGWFALGDFFWYFTQSPYSIGNDLYGRGTWTHYLFSYKNYIGNHGLYVFLIALLALVPYMLRQKTKKDENWFLILSAGMFFAVFLAHSYFWAKGINGSMGLTRITTQALPSFFICCFFLLDRFKILAILKKSLYPSLAVFVAFSFYAFKKLKPEQDISLTQMALVNGTKEIDREFKNVSGKFFYHHPLFAINMGFNSNRPDERSKFTYFYPFKEAKSYLKMGDFVAWDGQFGPQEMGVPFDTLVGDTNFILLRSYPAEGPFERNGLFLFQKVPAAYKRKLNTNYQNVGSSIELTLPKGTNEFFEIKKYQTEDPNESIRLKLSSPLPCLLVISDDKHIVYKTVDLSIQTEIDIHHQKNSALSVYIWNKERKSLDAQTLQLFQLKRTNPEPWKQ